jgi:tetratricopeptide (TPR) repeat protein
LYSAGQCGVSVTEYEKAARLAVPDPALLVDWAMALDCNQQYPEAIQRLNQALGWGKTAHIYSQIGMIRAKQGLTSEAWMALDAAVALDPNFAMAHFYRGNLHMVAGEWKAAESEYRRAIELSTSSSDLAQQALSKVQAIMRAEAEKKP